jgi:hypothetical protein
MFEGVALLGNTESSIALSTRKGAPIENLVELAPGEREIGIFRRYTEKHGANWEPRRAATGVYNCAGLVWASRRTSILDPGEWDKIISDDGYKWLPEGQLPVAGDIAVYVDQDNDEIYHVARVAFLRPGIVGGKKIPWAISKWNSTSGESIHSVYDVPFDKEGVNCALKYVTDRDLEE